MPLNQNNSTQIKANSPQKGVRKSFIRLFILSLAFISLVGCSGGVRIDYYKPFSTKLKGLKELISLDPELTLVAPTDSKSDTYQLASEKLKASNQLFTKIIARCGRNLNFKITVKSSGDLTAMDGDYLRELAPLKRNILQAGLIQIFGIANKVDEKGITLAGIQENAWESSPMLPSIYSHLEKKYGTRYFSTQGIRLYKKDSRLNTTNLLLVPPVAIADLIDPDLEVFYYNIVADIVDSRIIYREYRKLDMKNNESDIESIVYDSFSHLIGN